MKTFRLKPAVAFTSVMLLAGMAHANQEPGLYVVPYIGLQSFDNKLSLDDQSLFGLALGRQMPDNWAVEFAYSQTNTRTDASISTDVDTDYWHFDALYQFPLNDRWTPYVVFGLGSVKYDLPSSSEKDTQLNAGVGIQYSFNSRFSIRMDARGLLDTEDPREGKVAQIGLVYALGKCDYKKAKPMKAAEPAPAAQKQETVPAQVVEEKDTDGDGVMDSQDKCPDTSKGAKVDAQGCYVALEAPREFTLNVKFRSGSSDIQEDSKGQIAELAAFLAEYPQTKAVIEGHTDSDGAAELNRKLSQKRAEAVMQSLVKDYQVAADRLTAMGYGEDKPIADNATPEGKAQNRRVVAKVSTK